MHPTHSRKEKIRLFIRLFLPILIYQFANYSASFIDTMMTGQFSQTDLAGVSVAINFWSPLFSLLTGIVSALVPIVGQHIGAGCKEAVRRELYQFLYIALGMAALLLGLVLFGAVPFLDHMHLEGAVASIGQRYLRFISLGIVPLLLFSVFRSFFDALGLTRLSMYLMLLLVPFNAGLNYILIYGKWGLPALGGAGAGLGTALAYWLLLIIILVVMAFHPAIKQYNVWQPESIDWAEIRTSFALGLPIGLQIFAETAIFAVVGLLMAKYGSHIIASHQAAMNFATLMYAFPVSISMAMPILISYEVGGRRFADARAYGQIGRITALIISVFTQLFLFTFRHQIAGLYGSDTDFIRLTSQFLTYSLFFQLADAFAAPIQGILRGYKDTSLPFIIGAVSYWSVSIPLGMLLEWLTPLGAFSYWIGLIAGIFICGILLHVRLTHVVKRFEDK